MSCVRVCVCVFVHVCARVCVCVCMCVCEKVLELYSAVLCNLMNHLLDQWCLLHITLILHFITLIHYWAILTVLKPVNDAKLSPASIHVTSYAHFAEN